MAAEAHDNEDPKEAKKGSPLIKIVILVVILAALGGGGFFAYGKFFKKAPAEGDQGQTAAAPPEKQVICDWDPMLVNLADPGGKRYLKLGMKLELNNDRVLEEMKNRSFQIKDAMLMVVSSKEFDDIATPSGKQALKQEMMAQMNKIVKQGQVKDIFFTDFIIQ
ncbi:MAG: flagellar basal body-associated FliL family protein [Syntrophobacteraceae bacterium]|jgi:flagellar FliL protein|nr:flagellar basal body-associated FliL family protein [Syntrophobacteraceae bacterium]